MDIAQLDYSKPGSMIDRIYNNAHWFKSKGSKHVSHSRRNGYSYPSSSKKSEYNYDGKSTYDVYKSFPRFGK